LTHVLGDVPTVLEIKREKEGGDTILVIEVRHGLPSSTHYIDLIEIEIDGNLEKLSDLEPQTSTQFTEKLEINAGAKDVRVRAHCNIHGWSSWVNGEEEEPSGRKGISGFPFESIMIGLMLGILLLWWLSRKS